MKPVEYTPGMILVPGIYLNMPDHEYHSSDTVRRTKLWRCHDKTSTTHTGIRTAAMKFGSGYHALKLQPDNFHDLFQVNPFSGADGSKWIRQIKGEYPHLTVISSDEQKLMYRMSAVLDSKQSWLDLFDKAYKEVTIVWEEWVTVAGVAVKFLCAARPDILAFVEGFVIIADLKTCDNARKKDFNKEIGWRGYHFQLAWYFRGLNKFIKAETVEPVWDEELQEFVYVTRWKRQGRIISQEKDSRCEVAFYTLEDKDLQDGFADCEDALQKFAECTVSDSWESYPDSWEKIGRPGYQRRIDDSVERW